MWFRLKASTGGWIEWDWTDLSFNELLAVRSAVRRAFVAYHAKCEAWGEPIVRQRGQRFPLGFTPNDFIKGVAERFGVRVDLFNLWLYALKVQVANGLYEEGPVPPYKILQNAFRC